MAVSTDLLLNIKAPDVRAKTASAKTNPDPGASKDAASSFAQVYAKERQAKPVERHEPPAKPDRDKPVAEKDSQETAETKPVEAPIVAESGNELPPEESDTLTETDELLDPALMFGMGESVVNAQTPLDMQPSSGSEFLAVIAQAAQAAQVGLDGKAVSPDESPMGQQLVLGAQGTTQKMNQEKNLTPGEALESAEADENFAALLETGVAEESGEALELAALSPDLKQDRQNSGDSLDNRISPLAQAITQQASQAQQAQRPALVPGQPVSMQQPGWSEAMVDRVMWLSSQNLKTAEIQLDPAELGRMEVRIEMTKDQTQVTFMSAHAGVRDQLEGQMQRLRDMFSQQGMSMDVNVSDQSQARDWHGQGGGESSNGRSTQGPAAAEEELARGVMEISDIRGSGNRGLVDYFA